MLPRVAKTDWEAESAFERAWPRYSIFRMDWWPTHTHSHITLDNAKIFAIICFFVVVDATFSVFFLMYFYSGGRCSMHLGCHWDARLFFKSLIMSHNQKNTKTREYFVVFFFVTRCVTSNYARDTYSSIIIIMKEKILPGNCSLLSRHRHTHTIIMQWSVDHEVVAMCIVQCSVVRAAAHCNCMQCIGELPFDLLAV